MPRLIAAFGTRRERYPSAFEVACDSGIAPVHIRSGKIDRVSMRHACEDFTRQSFHEFAGQTIPACAWAKAFYQAHCHKPVRQGPGLQMDSHSVPLLEGRQALWRKSI